MLSEKDFCDRVWKKYEACVKKDSSKKNVFFGRDLYRNAHLVLCLKTCSLFLLAVVFTALLTGGVYAGVKYVVNKDDYVYRELERKETGHDGFGFDLNCPNRDYYNPPMNYRDGITYKKINDYEEYLIFNNEFDNIPEMTQSDFDDYFLMIFLAATNPDMYGLYVDTIEIVDDVLEIGISKEYENNERGEVCIKIPREKEREKIKVWFRGERPNMTNYVDMDDLPSEYSKEQAIEDGCVVIEDYTFLSEPNALREFIKRTEGGTNDNIRIVQYKKEILRGKTEVTDIEYEDGKYIVCVGWLDSVPGISEDGYRDDQRTCFFADKFNLFEYPDGESYWGYMVKEIYDIRRDDSEFSPWQQWCIQYFN